MKITIKVEGAEQDLNAMELAQSLLRDALYAMGRVETVTVSEITDGVMAVATGARRPAFSDDL